MLHYLLENVCEFQMYHRQEFRRDYESGKTQPYSLPMQFSSVFTVYEQRNICIAGLNRRASYATAYIIGEIQLNLIVVYLYQFETVKQTGKNLLQLFYR